MSPGPDSPPALLRFQDSAAGTLTGRRYALHDEAGAVRYRCTTEGHGISRPTAFLGPDDPGDERPLFTLTAKGKVLNLTYFLDEGGGRDAGGARVGTVHAKGVGFLWKLLDASEREVARVVDPTSLGTALLRDAFGGSPDDYVVLADGAPVARIGRTKRPLPDPPPRGLRGWIARKLRLSDWTLFLDPEVGADGAAPPGGRAATRPPVDERLLIAGTLLLIEHQVRSAGAT